MTVGVWLTAVAGESLYVSYAIDRPETPGAARGCIQGMGVYLKTGFAEESVGVGIGRSNAAHSKPDA